jgi:hypothetical protein
MRESLANLGVSPLVSMPQHLQREDNQCMLRTSQTMVHQNIVKGKLSSIDVAAPSSNLEERQATVQPQVRHCPSSAAMECFHKALFQPCATSAPLFRNKTRYKQMRPTA